ncbi:MAG: glycosyltransferase, partial [Lachnospiraceae bacterium]|nr:glycosyltransferase [Lachnospiraceae bacterium]
NGITSLQSQTYPQKEIIIVNDGSTDRTGDVCRKLAQKYENIQVLSLNDEGVSAARNAGIDKANGEYLMFADADDRLHPQMLQTLYDILMSTGSDVAGCGFFSWTKEEEWENGIRLKTDKNDKPHIFQRGEFLEEIAEGRDTRCWAKLYKRSVIGQHRFRKGLSIGEDMLFLLDILPDINKVVSIDFKGYGYYQNPAGAMKRKFTPAYMDQITCWETARDLIAQMDYSMKAKVTPKLLMAIMLTAGKLAFLSAPERKEQEDYVNICVEKLRRELQAEGAYAGLTRGYQRKISLFVRMPKFYLWLYHFRKYLK